MPATRDQAIFASHGTADTMIPVAVARKNIEFLRSHGYVPDYREYSMAHEVSLQVVSDLTGLAPQSRRSLHPGLLALESPTKFERAASACKRPCRGRRLHVPSAPGVDLARRNAILERAAREARGR